LASGAGTKVGFISEDDSEARPDAPTIRGP
jgi:hypothetical protein